MKNQVVTQSLVFEISRLAPEKALQQYKTGRKGLSEREVRRRQRFYGANKIAAQKYGPVVQLLSKFANPLVITLFVVAGVSFYFGEQINSIIVIALAVLSVILSFVQEYRANRNAQKLAERVKIKVKVIRDGHERTTNLEELVPGDLVALGVGDMVPADIRLISANRLYLNQSSLNGESFPVIKDSWASEIKSDDILDSDNIIFMGSSVVGGTGIGVVLAIGKGTQFGMLSEDISKVGVETAFEKGIKSYTWLMIRLIIILAAFIFFFNAIFKGNIVDALLFSLAVAVGLAPEMLPMIVTVNLSRGAMQMEKKKIIVKKLDSIQNFGAMDILCTDKTGTLTLDSIALIKYCDAKGREDISIFRYAYLNSHFETGLKNVLDQAILKHQKIETSHYEKIDELPYDFERRMMSVVLRRAGKDLLVAKGAPEEIIAKSSHFSLKEVALPLSKKSKEKIISLYESLSREGFRVLAIATKKIRSKTKLQFEDESDLVFQGFVTFLDPPKPDVSDTITSLAGLGVSLKILSGDNEMVTRKICNEVNFSISGIVNGNEISSASEHVLRELVAKANVFVRLTPLQKEKIIKALQSNGHVVGYLGDGVNDAPALKSADVGISVNTGMDIAKETAAIILLEKDLRVLCDCVIEGRKTFVNVIKYIKMGASSNLGNMISMTGASILLPFLPMLPPQVLLNNFLYDLSQVALPLDNVDAEDLQKPRPWDVNFIKEFMWTIGPVSSLFDFATFGIMWYVFRATPPLFRTGWFVESLLTQTLVVLIIRTKKIPLIQSRASKYLLYTLIAVIFVGAIIPYTVLARWFGFTPLPALFFLIILGLAAVYIFLVQIVKVWFIKKFGYE
ncbi:MAG: magnesium-translocating P-type ATPase [Candidatus Berkelbacteria bacterium]|nr:magnesium-translocating P-type ATPase [Candidatus Berkelbacteria bacterium]